MTAVQQSRLKRIGLVVMACAGTAMIVIATLVAVVETVAFDRAFYSREYGRLNTAAYVGVDQKTLDGATTVLLDYLQGKRENLDFEAQIGEESREYYNDREKAHMADVAKLNQNAVGMMVGFFSAGGALLAVAFVFCARRYVVWKSCFFTMIGILAVFFVLAVWAACDFNAFWISFHYVFFTNDLWMLDPQTSLLIRMYEEAFFFDLVGKILAWFLGMIAAALVCTGFLYKRMEKQCKKQLQS